MPPRRRRDGTGMQGLLPLRRRSSLTHAVSCWYCDFKSNIFNERLHSLGRRHSKLLQFWFTIGIGFGICAMVGTILILIWESSWLVASNEERNSLMGKSKESLYAATPVVPGISVPLRDIGYMSIGTLLSVGAHEFGHALAAASEGVHIEYIAVFLALLFPGAFVAFDYDTLQLLSSIRVLRIYCAGVWHNAVCCAVCWLTLASLPTLLYCTYKHGENPVVLNVPPMSSLAGYLSPGDIILEVDGIHVHNPENWVQKLNTLHLQSLQKHLVDDSHATNRDASIMRINTSHAERGFCVPNHWLLESQRIEEINHTLGCLDDHIPFGEIPCSNHTNFDTEGNTNFTEIPGDKSFCLRAKDVVQLPKCGDGWSKSQMTGICPCSESELCMDPGLSLGSLLIEITYSKADDPACILRHTQGNNGNLSIRSEIQENHITSPCQFTLLFVGTAASLAFSVQLTGYRPRRLILFNVSSPIWLPHMLEKLLVYTFHVSAALALLNSAPVFYLDGEFILETIISLLIPSHPRKKRRVLRLLLTCGTMLLLLGILAGFRMLFF